MAGGQVFDESLAALAPFGRIVAYGIASREQNEVSNGRLMRKSQAVVGFWLMHCLGAPRHDATSRSPTCSSAPPAASCTPVVGTHLPAVRGRAARTRTSRRAARTASSCWTRLA